MPPTEIITAREALHRLIERISSPAVLEAATLLLQPQAEAEEVDFWDSLSPELQARLRRSQESLAARHTEPLAKALAHAATDRMSAQVVCFQEKLM